MKYSIKSTLTGELMATTLSEVTPGQFEDPTVDPADVQRYGLAWLMRQHDGRYHAVLKGHSQHVKLTRDLPGQLGFKDLTYSGLYRLVHAGFVAASRITPDVIHIDLASLMEHILATRDPQFWTRENRRKFSDPSVKPPHTKTTQP